MVPGTVHVAAEVLDKPVDYAWSGRSNWAYLFKSVDCLMISEAFFKFSAVVRVHNKATRHTHCTSTSQRAVMFCGWGVKAGMV